MLLNHGTALLQPASISWKRLCPVSLPPGDSLLLSEVIQGMISSTMWTPIPLTFHPSPKSAESFTSCEVSWKSTEDTKNAHMWSSGVIATFAWVTEEKGKWRGSMRTLGYGCCPSLSVSEAYITQTVNPFTLVRCEGCNVKHSEELLVRKLNHSGISVDGKKTSPCPCAHQSYHQSDK